MNWLTAKLEHVELKLKHRASHLKTPVGVTCSWWPSTQGQRVQETVAEQQCSQLQQTSVRPKAFPICRGVLRDHKGRLSKDGHTLQWCKALRWAESQAVQLQICSNTVFSRKSRRERCHVASLLWRSYSFNSPGNAQVN